MAEKKNPDYSNTAVNLCNPEEVRNKLAELHIAQEQIKLFEGALAENENFKEMKRYEQMVSDMTAQIKGMVDAQGSYQDTENGFYAVKYIRKSKVYHTDPFLEHYPKYAPAVVVQTINAKALEGLVKGGLIEEADLRMHKVFTEDISYAYVVK